MQRCRAKSKRSGKQCKNYAVKGCRVCRMHGVGGGPKTRRGLLACKKAPYRHGLCSQEALRELRLARLLMKKSFDQNS